MPNSSTLAVSGTRNHDQSPTVACSGALEILRCARLLEALANGPQPIAPGGHDRRPERTSVCLRDNLDLNTPTGCLMMDISFAMAQFEPQLVKERVSEACTQQERWQQNPLAFRLWQC